MKEQLQKNLLHEKSWLEIMQLIVMEIIEKGFELSQQIQ